MTNEREERGRLEGEDYPVDDIYTLAGASMCGYDEEEEVESYSMGFDWMALVATLSLLGLIALAAIVLIRVLS